ncbi:MAG: hypothetical protein JNM56_12180 [Planctomycetia bacterium]|nr:hypothetical protein [Planctomycetia bacterium]
MLRLLRLATVLLLATGCATVPAEPIPLQPLPADKDEGVEYGQILLRARQNAMSATEAFYLNQWNELDEAGRRLDQSARLLLMATAVPAKQKDKLDANAADLQKEAAALREAAKAQDTKRSSEVLQRLHLKVREMRAE